MNGSTEKLNKQKAPAEDQKGPEWINNKAGLKASNPPTPLLRL